MSSTTYLTSRYKQNIANISRDFFWTKFNTGANYIHNFRFSTEHPPSIVIDAEIKNNDATVSTISFDGVQISISAGTTKSFQNIPFTEFRVLVGTNIDIIAAGKNILGD